MHICACLAHVTTLPQACLLILVVKHCENFCPLQGSFRPCGPKVTSKSKNEFPGLSASGPKNVQNGGERVKIDYFSTILTLFRLCFGLFCALKPRGPGTHLPTLFATLGPKGPNDPCSRSRESLVKHNSFVLGFAVRFLFWIVVTFF